MEPAMILQKRQSVITMECYQRGSEIPSAARNPYALVKNLQELLDIFYDAIYFQILIYPKFLVMIAIPRSTRDCRTSSIQPHQKHGCFSMRFAHDFLRALFIVFGDAHADPISAHGTAELEHLGCTITPCQLLLQLARIVRI